MLYKGPQPKAGINLNGKDILEYDPIVVGQIIQSMPEKERELVQALIRGKQLDSYEEMTGFVIPKDYAKEYGRPSLEERPFGTCENDGYPYLGGGHSPNCDGKLDYTETIYDNRKICWCMWSCKATPDRRTNPLWIEHDKKYARK